MTQLKKGCDAWLITDYNHGATIAVRKLRIESFGKKQGTATYIENGMNLQCQLYADQLGKTLFHANDVADIETFALDMARQQKARWIQHYVERAHDYCDGGANDHYHFGMKKKCQAVIDEAPNAIYL